MGLFIAERLAAVAALVVASASLAGTETALFSLSKLSREALASSESRSSRRVAAMLTEPRRLIVTLILCNELVNIANSSVVATLVARLFPEVAELGQVLIATALVLPLILVFGEMLPKSLALRLGDAWGRVAAWPLGLLAALILPVRLLVQWIASVVLALLGARPMTREEGLREEEFRALVDVGSQQGELQGAERRLIHNVFEFGDTTVGKVMTPADRVFALSYEMPLGRMVEAIAASRFSRVPIFRPAKKRPEPRAARARSEPTGARGGVPGAEPRRGAQRDVTVHGASDIVGVLLAKDLVGYAHGALEGHTVQDLLHPVLFVPRTTKCDQLFREFQRRRTHIALVVDEYGRLAGLVTMEDLLEELFGEIADEKEVRT